MILTADPLQQRRRIGPNAESTIYRVAASAFTQGCYTFRMLKIGHRGRPGNPRQGENTLRSFEAALAAGADALEFDIRKSKDGALVVIHDATVDRTTNGRGKVCDISYAGLATLDAGFGASIPLLSAALEKCGGRCLLNIELKERGIEKLLKTEITERGLPQLPYLRSIIVSAFDQDDNDRDASSSWEQLAVFAPEIPIALLATAAKVRAIGEAGFVQRAKEYGAAAINPECSAVTEELIERAHEGGLLVYAWVANEPGEIQRLKDMRVDGIFSDFVERL
jgi:glycerophosphoryl diester phosphodiesterase